MEHLFVLKTLSRTQRATKVKKFVGICLKPLRSRVMPRNMSDKANNANYSDLRTVSFLRLTRSKAPEGTQRLSTTFMQPCQKRYLLMPLSRRYPVLERELSTDTRTVTTRGVANFRARALVDARYAVSAAGFSVPFIIHINRSENARSVLYCRDGTPQLQPVQLLPSIPAPDLRRAW